MVLFKKRRKKEQLYFNKFVFRRGYMVLFKKKKEQLYFNKFVSRWKDGSEEEDLF